MPANKVTVFWHPEIVPTAVVLGHTPGSFAGGRLLDKDLLARAVAHHHGHDGLHVLLPGGHHIWLVEHGPGAPIAAVIPLDEDFLLRVTGALRLRRHLNGQPAGPMPRPLQLTPRHRKRLIQMLRALDGRLSEATYREIAELIFGPNTVHEPGWKTLPVRAQTIRLVKDAIAMMNRGYLNFLKGR